MKKIRYPKIPCAKPGCKMFAMFDGSGLCLHHNPALAEQRHQNGLKMVETNKKCQKENCRRTWGMDSSGFCFSHSPLKLESRKKLAIKFSNMCKEALPEDRCHREGCKRIPMRNSSGFCFSHDPAMKKERLEGIKKLVKTKRTRQVPLELRCKFEDCKLKAKENGSQFCYHHQPDYRERQRKRMLGNNINFGRQMPWMGLNNFEEAQRLIIYSLVTDQPHKAVRAFEKIASLRARGLACISPENISEDPEDNANPTYFGFSIKSSTPHTSDEPDAD